MANNDNLRTPTTTEAREMGRKGGIASGEARRKRKSMKESLDFLLSLPAQMGDDFTEEEIKTLMDLNGKAVCSQDIIMFSMVKKAMKGDVKSAQFIRDTVGERLGEQQPNNDKALDKLDEVLAKIGGVTNEL